MNNFVKALIATAVPLIATTLIAAVIPVVWLWPPLITSAAALVAIIVFAIRGQRRIVLGIVAGGGIGVLAMFITLVVLLIKNPIFT